MKKNMVFALVLCGLFLLSVTPLIGASQPAKDFQTAQPDGIAIYSILNNTELSLLASSGAGTEESPYIISGGSITEDFHYAFYIEGTTAYFAIEGFDINPTSFRPYGFYLKDVVNGIIRGNTIQNVNRPIAILEGCSNILVFDNDVIGGDGILVNGAENVNLTLNNVDGSIDLRDADAFTLKDNTFTNGGIRLAQPTYMTNSTSMTGNTVNGKGVLFLYDATDMIVDGSPYAQIFLILCMNVTIENGVFQHVPRAIQVLFSSLCVIDNVTVTDSNVGIFLYESDLITVRNSTLNNNGFGIHAIGAAECRVISNHIEGNTYMGIHMDMNSHDSYLYLNTLIDNGENVRDDGGIPATGDITWMIIAVRNSVSLDPVANALVVMQRYNRVVTMRTNDRGNARIPIFVVGGQFNLTVWKFPYQIHQSERWAPTEQGEIGIYPVLLDKADRGAGDGWVLCRALDESSSPIPSVRVRAYQYLDGAFYFHQQKFTGALGFANMTDLYIGTYALVFEHDLYETHYAFVIVNQNGFSTIRVANLVEVEATVLVAAYDYDTGEPLEYMTVNATKYNEGTGIFENYMTGITNYLGQCSLSPLAKGIYNVTVYGADHLPESEIITVETDGDWPDNPLNFTLFYFTEEPPTPTTPMALASDSSLLVNYYDNNRVGNYWSDYTGSGWYQVQGENYGCYDRHPNGWNNPTYPPTWPTTTTPNWPPESSIWLMVLSLGAIIAVIVLMVVVKRRG